MPSSSGKARTLDEVISSLPIEDQARVVARASELVTEVLQPQDQGSPQPSHDEESPIMSESMSPIDRIIISGPNSTEVDLRPITVLLGDNNSGRSAFLRPLWRLHLNVKVNQNEEGRTYIRMPEWGLVDTQLLSLRCDGVWTRVAVDVPALGPDRVRVVEAVDPNPPELYPAIHLPEPLHASVKEIIQVDGDGNQYVLMVQLGSMAVASDYRLKAISDDVCTLGLGQGIRYQTIQGGSFHLFVVSDTGELFSIHQAKIETQAVLHVLIALRLATAGQLVHMVNPEAGLHPRAVIALTGLLVEAARRGVRLIVETQSTTIVRALQLAVAEDDSGWVRDNLALYWFDRTGGGAPKVTMADVQADGSFGEWPYDLSTVELDLTRSLLVASHRRRAALQALAKVGL